jgi:DNA polymerase
MPWGDMRDSITYMNLNDKNQWVRVSTHPGKITENIDQAIARDLLAHGMTLAEKEGINIHLHVHDQIVGMVSEKGAEEKLRILIECMSETPRWAPGLPLKAEGHISKFFIKD